MWFVIHGLLGYDLLLSIHLPSLKSLSPPDMKIWKTKCRQ